MIDEISMIAVILLGLTLVAFAVVMFLLAIENIEKRHRLESYGKGYDSGVTHGIIAYGFFVETALGLCFGVLGLYLMLSGMTVLLS